MKLFGGSLRLAASDLSSHLACRHLTALDLEVATGARDAAMWNAPDAWVLQQRGLEHEAAYLEHLKSHGWALADLREVGDESASEELTLKAMRDGMDIIAQATMRRGRWFGRADVLRKVTRGSKLGAWSYEAYDCKLARETKGATILQLSLYSELLGEVQGVLPDFMHVVPPTETFEAEQYRVLDYAAYYRHVKHRLESAVDRQDSDTYPEPAAQCGMCKWYPECDRTRRLDDHLSLVAGINRLQRKQLREWDTNTVADLARFPLPIPYRPAHGSRDGYARIREQARVQVAGRTSRHPVHEIFEVTEEHGLTLLPAPSEGDVFFDLEGDPFIGRNGREYLFGMILPEPDGTVYASRWALTPEEEKQAFEWFMDTVMERWANDPRMHIYHFAPYEPAAVKRLMGRYGTRESEVDQLLRGKRFIDLHTVVKRSLRASVEQYSLKALEEFHSFIRQVPLEDARKAMRRMQHALELERAAEIDTELRLTIAGYNADDCLSTLSLRNWLEREREIQERSGHTLPRPVEEEAAAPETVSERQERAARLVERLRDGIPTDPAQQDQEQSARWLLSNLIDWHRREVKAEWWEYYRLRDKTDEELLDERSALSGLGFVERIEVARQIPTDRYSFEKQETDVRTGNALSERGEKLGTVVGIDLLARTIDIKKTRKTAERHPTAVFVDARGPSNDVLADSIYRLGAWVADHGFEAVGPHRAALDLLLRVPPRLTDGKAIASVGGRSMVERATELVSLLDHSVLAIQGPPGAGKTFTGARMICDLVRQGRTVGVTATTHRVIQNLLEATVEAAAECGLHNFTCLAKVSDIPEQEPPGITFTTDNTEALAALNAGGRVVGGTAWLWAREEYAEAVDVLFVDEAGQMSLANVLTVSQAARSIVLLGDPQQLEQPQKGSHPQGSPKTGQ